MNALLRFLGLTALPHTVRRVLFALVAVYLVQLVMAVLRRPELEVYGTLVTTRVLAGEVWRVLSYGALHLVGTNPLLDAVLAALFLGGLVVAWRSPWGQNERGLLFVAAFVIATLIQHLGHGAGFHLLFNAFALVWFGPQFERSWGARRFLVFLLSCVAGGGVAVVAGDALVDSWPEVAVAGFSGASQGLIVAFAVYQPNTTIMASMVLPLKASYLVIGLVLLSAIDLIPSARYGDLAPGASQALAHLGGMLTAYLMTSGMWRPGKLRRAFAGEPKNKPSHLRVVRPPDKWVH